MLSASVIVRTRDEARHLPRLLAALRAQNVQPHEIVVVDSGSSDATVAIAEEGADRVVHIPAESFTFGRSLNVGCAAATGEAFVFVSAHTYPSSNNWLGNLLIAFDDERVGMVYGRQLPYPGTRLPEAHDFVRHFGPHSRELFDEPSGNNANAAVRAAVWREHAFDEQLSGLEDLEWARFAQSRGYAVRYAANAGIVHIHEESVRQVYRRHRREGVAHAELFPTGRPRLLDAAATAAADVLRDLRFGRLMDVGTRDLLAAPAFRLSAAAGAYRGSQARARRRASAARLRVGRPAPGHAVTISSAGTHEIEERGRPTPAPGWAVVRVAHVGVCATDVELADGHQIYYRTGRTSYPIVPGHEWSGVVEAVGAGSDRGWVGRRVVGECVLGCGTCSACRDGVPARCGARRETGVLIQDGAYASWVQAPLHALHRVPDGLPLRTASLVEPLAVVHKAVRYAGNVRGATVAVVGTGPIGHSATQLLRARGADVLAIDREPSRLSSFSADGLSTAVTLDRDSLGGVDIVIEATGNPDAVRTIVAEAPERAQIVVIGVPGEDGAATPAAPGADPSRVRSTLASDPADWPIALGLLADGAVELHALERHSAPLADYAEAWDAVRERRRLKTILVVDPELADE
jgi:threonine dehydrogenase-like Zn-dependent dehydrogenase/GT2 family glycosyltransferase